MHYVITVTVESGEEKIEMISKLLISLAFLVLITAVGGFIVLAVWDVPVLQKTVEKPIDTSRFLEKKS
jgi:hypothetical protein